MDTQTLMNGLIAALGGAPAPLITKGIEQLPSIQQLVAGYEDVAGDAVGVILLFLLGYFLESDIIQMASYGAAGKLGGDLVDKFVVSRLG